MIGQSDWTEEQWMIALFPIGSRFSLILAGYTKWMLATFRYSAKVQLELLEDLNKLAHDHFTARALAEVRPATDTSAEMITTAFENDPADEKLSPSYRILTGWEVFNELLRLNPSWLRAIRLCSSPAKEAA